ncbi:hypothetical protein [Paenibacillus spongiae]|uniref:Glycosyl hydrolase family 32 N-terminal domain-containing protein n=1 Tax=Paenibacillus spongiae TaxID=2909671 RepID=A0ABY5S0X3_9BACL|nr:hypothetical protein [Paenibacillus spongiae]UVI27501.1 hypothetical protein L1F29_18710 [Paenibacillus spongiae]
MTAGIASLLSEFKLGRPVISGSGLPGSFDEKAVDCPFVFEHQGRYFMMYVGFDGIGYQTALAVSDNLTDWSFHGLILERERGSAWDSANAAGNWLLKEDRLDQPPLLKKWRGKYWMVYHSYPGEGYENGPGQIGIAWTEDDNLLQWNRSAEPVLSPFDGNGWEEGGLYKGCLIEHDDRFYLFYNAKNHRPEGQAWTEQTGLATSTDLIHWERYEGSPVLQVSGSGGWDSLFASDPFVVHDGNRWVMYYFGYNGRHAQEGIAFSDDLLHWSKHEEPIIRHGAPGELDEIHAHKPAVLLRDGVLYHYYCACRPYREGDPSNNNGEFRCITLAASESLA